jgi:phosphopantetheinyl transferase (holo-ACP synthase)
VALIAHPTCEVGIDIEKTSDKICRLQQRFLHSDELRHIDYQNEINHLLLHWSAKEVLFKILNQEGIDFSEHLRIRPFIPQLSGTFFGNEMISKQNALFTFTYSIEKEFVMVWAVK